MGCARSERPTRRLCRSDETRAPDERDPLEASVRRGWRESSKRSSASVRADAPFRGEAQAGPERLRREKRLGGGRAAPSETEEQAGCSRGALGDVGALAHPGSKAWR